MQLNLRRRRPRNDRGAVAPLVGILVATGVITGMLALTVDVGGILWERRQLQNGADASAMGLAALCADAAACDPATTGPELQPFLDGNAADGATRFDPGRPGTDDGQCGSNTGNPAMPDCVSDTGYEDLEDCPPLPDWLGADIPYVETYTRTETGDGGTVLPPVFSQTLTGGDPEASVSACARAAWGTPSSYTATVPLTISFCEWEWFTDPTAGPPAFYDAPQGSGDGYGGAGQAPWPGDDIQVEPLLHTPSATEDDLGDCHDNGKDMPGGFGWLDASGDCRAEIVDGDWVNTDPGNSVPNDCKSQLDGLLGTVVALPVFDCMQVVTGSETPSGDPDPATCQAKLETGGGAKTWYHIDGWAAFYLSGWYFSGSPQPSLATGSVPCSGSDRCIAGWFVSDVLEDTGGAITPPGDGYGAVVVRLAG
jgi:hypothetical protein